MERRQFLSWVSVGMLATSLPMVLAACGSDEAEPTSDAPASDAPASDAPEATADAPASDELDTAVRDDGFQALATVAAVDSGAVLDKENAASPVIMVRDPDSGAVVALSPVCPHAQCTVDFDGESGQLICPCHDSKFSLDGSIEQGPAQEPLPVFEVKEEEGLVLVKVS